MIGNMKRGERALVQRDDGKTFWRPVRNVLVHEFNGKLLNMGADELVTFGHSFRKTELWHPSLCPLVAVRWVPASEIFIDADQVPFSGLVWNLEMETDREDEKNYLLANGWCAHNLQ